MQHLAQLCPFQGDLTLSFGGGRGAAAYKFDPASALEVVAAPCIRHSCFLYDSLLQFIG